MKIEITTVRKNGLPVYEPVEINAIIPLTRKDFELYRQHIQLPDPFIMENKYTLRSVFNDRRGVLVYDSDQGDGLLIHDNTRPDGFYPFPGARQYLEYELGKVARYMAHAMIAQEEAYPYQQIFELFDVQIAPGNGIAPLLATCLRQLPEVYCALHNDEKEQVAIEKYPQCVRLPMPQARQDFGRLMASLRRGTPLSEDDAQSITNYVEHLHGRNAYLERLMASYDEGLNPLAAQALGDQNGQFRYLLDEIRRQAKNLHMDYPHDDGLLFLMNFIENSIERWKQQ